MTTDEGSVPVGRSAPWPEGIGGRLRAGLETAGVGLWHIDGASGVVHLSARMQRLLGTGTASGTVGIKDLFGLLDADDRARVREGVAEALRTDGSVSLDLRIRQFDGGRYWFQISGAIERDADTGAIRGEGIAVDITERKGTEQRLSLAEAVSRVMARADTLDEAFPEVLAAIASGTDMDLALLWLPGGQPDALHCAYTHVEHLPEARFEHFLGQVRDARFELGKWLPGSVWQQRKAVWVESVTAEPRFERLPAASADGLVSGIAIPLLVGSVSVGVIEAFTTRHTAPDDGLLETLTGLGQELGQFILRARAEDRLRQSDARQRLLVEILQSQREAEDPDEVMRVATEALARHLAVQRVGFLDVRGARIVLQPGWVAPDVEPLERVWPASVTNEAYRDLVRQGRSVVIDDVASNPLAAGVGLEAVGVHAAISIPIMRSGRRSAGMYIHSATARHWGPAEVSLAREVADHTWDAVERLRAEAARREGEALAQTISDNSTQALVLMDHRGYVRYANAACLEMTGFEGEEIRSRPVHDLLHHHYPDGRPYPSAECPIEEARAARAIVREHEDVFFRKDGSAFPVVCAVSPLVRPGRPDATIIEIRDVSATRAAARALEISERRFRNTFENAAVGVANVAEDGRWLRVNRRLCEITGYGEDELLGRSFQDITHPDDLEADMAQVDEVLSGRSNTYTLEKRYMRKDGRSVWVELTVSVGHDGEDAPPYFIAIVNDVEARKLAESRMQTALAVKEEFLGLVSHELRTPMTVILGMSQVLARESIDLDRARAIAADIAESAHELNELIESMLLLARLDQDEEVMREPAVLGRVAAESIERLRARGQGRRYLLDAPASVIVDANPGLLDRVITNLLVNAAKYSNAGEDIRLVIVAHDGEVQLHVLDAGPGLDDAELARVFEPFYRASGSKGAPGAGLGLSVASRIIESLGGHVWASRRDGGSDFGFGLPLLEPDDEE